MSLKERAETEIVLSGGQKAGKTINELTAQSVKLYREIKKMEEGSEEFIKATEDYQKINGRLKSVRNEVNGISKAQKELNTSVAEYMPFAGHLKRFQDGYKGVMGAIKGATVSQRALNIAIAASGIGALIMLLVGLVKSFTSTQAGMDKVTAVTRPLFAIFEKLKGLVQELSQNVFKGLGEILNGDIRKGLATLGSGTSDAIKGVGGAIKEGAAAGRELDQLQKQIETTQNGMILSQSRLNREIAKQSALAKDMSLSETERNKAAKEGIRLLEEQAANEDKLLALQQRKKELENSLNDTSRADEGELNQIIAEREQLQANLATRRVELTGIVNQTVMKGEADTTKAVVDENAKKLKAQEEYAKMVESAESSLAALRISMIADDTERKTAEYLRDIEAFKGNEDQKAEYAKIRRAQLDQELKAIEEAKLQEDLKQMQEDEEIRRLVIEENFFTFLLTEDEREQQLYELKRDALLERLELIREMHGEESSEYRKHSNEIAKLEFDQNKKRLDDAKAFADAKKQMEQMTVDAVQDTIGATLQLLSQEQEGRKKNIGAIKAFKAAQLKMSFINEVGAIWETSNASPTNILFPGSGNIIAGIKTAAASIRFGAGLRELKGQKLSLGGPVFGPSHANGGIPFRVKGSNVTNEMEGNEIVMTKGVYQDPVLRAAASMINEAGGGRSFAMGGPVSTPTGTGQTASQVVNNITNNTGSGEDTKKLLGEIMGLRSDLNSWQSQFEVKLSLQKLKETNNRFEKVVGDASF